MGIVELSGPQILDYFYFWVKELLPVFSAIAATVGAGVLITILFGRSSD